MTLMELRSVSMIFGKVEALRDVSLSVGAGEVLCLLGDNGAGKSTLIKVMSGVYQPTSGELLFDGAPVTFGSPRDAQERGVATVHQDVGTLPLMGVARNFFLGREPEIGWWPFRRIDFEKAERLALTELAGLGLRRVRDAKQAAGTLSGGERQALAIGRAMYFGARLLILDEPTSALGVKESSIVLRLIQEVAARGVGVVVITHNAHQALTIGDRFAVLIQGRVASRFGRGERSDQEVLSLMAGGEEMEELRQSGFEGHAVDA